MENDNLTSSIKQLFKTTIDEMEKKDKDIWKENLQTKIQTVNNYYIQLKNFKQLKRAEAKSELLEKWDNETYTALNNFRNRLKELNITIEQNERSQIFTKKRQNLKKKYAENSEFKKLIINQLKQLQQSSEVLKRAYEKSGIVKNFNEKAAKVERERMEGELKTAILDLYQYLHEIGKAIGLGTIKYHIIIETKDVNGDLKLLEGDIPLETLTKYLTIEGRSNDYSLRLKKTISELEGKGLIKVEGDNLDKYKKLKSNKDYTGKNLGNFGEFYRNVIFRGIDINDSKELLDILEKVKENTENFMTPDMITNFKPKQGEEIKAYIGNSPTFLSVEAVLNQGAQFLAILQGKLTNVDETDKGTIQKIIQETRESTFSESVKAVIKQIKEMKNKDIQISINI